MAVKAVQHTRAARAMNRLFVVMQQYPTKNGGTKGDASIAEWFAYR
jgi:hypothetical protein